MTTKSKKKTAVKGDQLIDSVDAAKLLKITPSTLRTWRSERREHQPPFIRVGRSIKYDKTELKAWIAANRSA